MKEKNKRQLAKLKYEEKKKEEEKRQKFEQEFLKGIQNEEFKVYIQGKVDAKTEKWIGGELLVRWKKENKVIYPDEFIPLLEKYNLISKLDYYMIEKAYYYLEKWEKEKKNSVHLSINQSLLTIKEENYLEKIKEIQSSYSVVKNELEIELTESVFVEDRFSLQETIQRLHQLKIQVSMDDFGTGYSSFHRIQDYEIDTIKLDKAFLQEERNLKKGRIVLESMIQMCHRLGIKTVAEGVEVKEQVNFLKRIGCDLLQGYYYSKPIPMEEFEKEWN
ncbi:MAG TPA: EAL domain-containing protein [Candidatus Merdicola faecigallinarum]|uniref:EAL domain-containing protein n=1 Tax=Candidatus Merdicola faecigallinarum TaxID=2840862 RepID=A0A9D1M010_9FIRM|nr:EAL domain-containing protein [Candidatus Merdicola faecigallinarum]